MKRIFVTGGTGFLGSHFLKQLAPVLDVQDKVFVLCRKQTVFPDLRFQCLVGDLRNMQPMRETLLNCHYVFHLGGEARFGNHLDYAGDNILPTQTMVAMLEKSTQLKNFVFTSTIGAFDRDISDRLRAPLTLQSIPRPTSKYGKSKLECERIIRQSGIPFTIIRPTWIYGRGMRLDSHINAFVSMLTKLPQMAHFRFPGQVSVVHVEDMARALVNAIDNSRVIGQCYFGVTQNLALGEILKRITRCLSEREIWQIPIPSLRPLIGLLHPKLPLAVTNLFVDYLCASDDTFIRDFRLGAVRDFETSVSEVVDANPRARGAFVITGANSGIGFALATELKKLGQRLILVDRDTTRISGEFRDATVLTADIVDPSDRDRLVQVIGSQSIRCLMNIAGVGFKGNFVDLPSERVRAMIDVNITGTLLLTQALKTKLLNERADIVNIASSVAYYPLPGMSVYAATKAFLASWSEALAVELKKTNQVFTISPGGTKTNFQRSAGVRESRDLVDPSRVARRILADLKTRPKSHIYGFRSQVMALGARLLPQRRMAVLVGHLFEGAR